MEEITEAELYKYAESEETALKEFARRENREEAIINFLENVTEIRREQTFNSSGKWETVRYSFLVTYGGPNILLSTDGTIKVAWGSNNLNYIINDKEVLNFLNDVEDYLNQAFP